MKSNKPKQKCAKLTREELIRYLLSDKNIPVDKEEDLINLLVDMQISYNVEEENLTFSQKMADKLADFAGSWGFIISFFVIIMIWIITNVVFLINPFDPFPFILLNLGLSCIAALQAPIIMMSQNRQEERDRLRGIQDYEVNLKTELLLESLYKNLNKSINKISQLELKLNDFADKIEKSNRN